MPFDDARLAGLALAAILLARVPAGAAEPAPAPRAAGYNLILISLGNVGAAHMSLYGYARKTTPRLDAWAKDAVVFDAAYSPASWTLPVGTSLFTGLYPYAHGVTERGRANQLNAAVATLPEVLARAGYATAAFTGGLDYDRGFAHMRGFQTAPENPDFTGYETTLAQASGWLSTHQDKPFFLFVHGYDAHCPFVPPPAPYRGAFGADQAPPGFDGSRCLRGINDERGDYTVEAGPRCDLDRVTLRCLPAPAAHEKLVLHQADVDHLRDLYDEDVLGVDGRIGDFLASLSTATLSRTVVVVFCEHGEMFAKHGLFGRPGAARGVFYDDVIHVPLIVRAPGVSGARVRALASLVDVTPTALDLLGLPPAPGPVQGRDLAPLIEGRGGEPREVVFSGSSFDLSAHTGYARPLAASSARDVEWKLISEQLIPREYFRTSRKSKGREQPPPVTVEKLFRVSQDPDERVDLISRRPDVAERLRAEIRRWRAECADLLARRPPGTRVLPQDLLDDARRRGYW